MIKCKTHPRYTDGCGACTDEWFASLDRTPDDPRSLELHAPCPCNACTPSVEPPVCEPVETWCEVTVWGD